MLKLFTTLFFVLSLIKITAQNSELDFADKAILQFKSNKRPPNFLCETSNAIYAIFDSKSPSIIVYDKNTLKSLNKFSLQSSTDPTRANLIRNKKFHSAFCKYDEILVFYTEETKTQIKLFGEVLSLKFESLVYPKELTSIYKDKNTPFFSNFPQIHMNNGRILISNYESNNFTVSTDVFSTRLNKVSDISDMRILKTSPEFYNNYNFIDSKGNLYFYDVQKIPAENNFSFCYTVINPKNDSTRLIRIYDENKSFFNGKIIEVNEKVYCYGFFCDFEKDSLKHQTHGIFTSEINSAFSEVRYTYFEDNFVDSIRIADIKFNQLIKDKIKFITPQKSYHDPLSRSITIEDTKIDENGNLYLFCSRIHNYKYPFTYQTSQGRFMTTELKACDNSSVIVFKLDTIGNLVWSSKIDRNSSFKNWDVYDLSFVEDETYYYVSYLTNFILSPTKDDFIWNPETYNYTSFNKLTGETKTFTVKLKQ